MTLKKTSRPKLRLRNKFERDVERQLRRAKVQFQYEGIKIPYILARHYIPDYIVDTPLGKIYIECKGYLRPEHKSKMVAVKKQHPEKDIRILFYSHNKKQIKWAEKCGYRYAIETVPKEWFMGL